MASRRRDPYANIGSGLGRLISWYLSQPLRERQKAVQEIKQAASVAMMTGDKGVMEQLAISHPEAATQFQQQTGLPYFAPPEGFHGVDVPPMQGPVAAGGPTQFAPPPTQQLQAPGPMAGMQLPAAPGGPMIPPALGGVPPTAETVQRQQPVPWPSSLQDIKARSIHESMAGRELPAPVSAMLGMQPPPTDIERFIQNVQILEDVEDPQMKMELSKQMQWPLGMAAPSEAALSPEVEGPSPPKPSTWKTFFEMWPNASDLEKRTFAETGEIPTRNPVVPEDEADQPDAWEVKLGLEVQGATGQLWHEVYKEIREGTWDGQAYADKLGAEQDTAFLISMIRYAQTLRASDPKRAKKILNDYGKLLAESMGYTWEDVKPWWEKARGFLESIGKKAEVEAGSIYERIK